MNDRAPLHTKGLMQDDFSLEFAAVTVEYRPFHT